jgi:hydroxyacylglutathione hydrolase
MMLASLDALAALPDETRVFCGHEYTEANLRFAMTVEPRNSAIMDYVKRAVALRATGSPTLPSTIGLEKRVNPFLRSRHEDVKSAAEHRAAGRCRRRSRCSLRFAAGRMGFHD